MWARKTLAYETLTIFYSIKRCLETKNNIILVFFIAFLYEFTYLILCSIIGELLGFIGFLVGTY